MGLPSPCPPGRLAEPVAPRARDEARLRPPRRLPVHARRGGGGRAGGDGRARRAGMGAVLTRLGENVATEAEADAVAAHYLDLLERVKDEGGASRSRSSRRSSGSTWTRSAARAPARAGRARGGDRQLRLDRHGADRLRDATLRLVRRRARRVIPASVCASSPTCAARRPTWRRCSPPAPASGWSRAPMPSRPSTPSRARRTWTRATSRSRAGCWSARRRCRACAACSGTHDRALIDAILADAAARGLPRSAAEFHLLFGIQRAEQERLARRGLAGARAHQLWRVLVPLVHAAPGRAPGQRPLRRAEPALP
jgi:hypothetical protein